MTNEIAIIEKPEIDLVPIATRYLQNLGINISKAHTEQFLHICNHYQLDPFKREIYAVAYGNKFNIIVGYEAYLKRADKTGSLDGWKAYTEGTFELTKTNVIRKGKSVSVDLATGNLKGCILVYRKDWKNPFYHEVFLSEYAQPNEMWCSKPITMIKKVATAQAFRLAFPNDFGGMPYTSDELNVNLDAQDTKGATAADFSEEYKGFSAEIEAIENLPHLKAWNNKNADKIKKTLSPAECSKLSLFSQKKLDELKEKYKNTMYSKETFKCGLDGKSYTHEDCIEMTCRQHCEHFNPDQKPQDEKR